MDEAGESEFKARMDELDQKYGPQYYNRKGEQVSSYEWMRNIKWADRRVALTRVDKYFVSTVLLGLDNGFGLNSKPVIFETMIWWEPDVPKKSEFSDHEINRVWDDYQERYCTEEEAIIGHAEAVDIVRLVMELMGDIVVPEDLTKQDQESDV